MIDLIVNLFMCFTLVLVAVAISFCLIMMFFLMREEIRDWREEERTRRLRREGRSAEL